MLRAGLVCALLGLMGCGPAEGVRLYRGTTTNTTISGGTNVTTTAGVLQLVAPGNEPNEWIFYSDGIEFTGKLSGTTLNFVSGQTITETGASSMTTTSLSNGSGSMTSESLQLSLTLSSTSTFLGTTTTTTFTLTFSGQRE